ncbi:MAG: hypothetical protein ACTSVD_07905 [Candidatus Thorarchaeota archaeon]|nr:MAG: hypothetical protein DRO73_08045 [Candidatus Thorarchaeota archaeon]
MAAGRGESIETAVVSTTTHRTLIRNLNPDDTPALVRFKVLRTRRAAKFVSRRTGRPTLLVEREVADESAKIILILWNHEVDLVRRGLTYLLHGGRVVVRDHAMYLTRGSKGWFTPSSPIELIDTEADMSVPFAWLGERDKHANPRTTIRRIGGDGRRWSVGPMRKEF